MIISKVWLPKTVGWNTLINKIIREAVALKFNLSSPLKWTAYKVTYSAAKPCKLGLPIFIRDAPFPIPDCSSHPSSHHPTVLITQHITRTAFFSLSFCFISHKKREETRGTEKKVKGCWISSMVVCESTIAPGYNVHLEHMVLWWGRFVFEDTRLAEDFRWK